MGRAHERMGEVEIVETGAPDPDGESSTDGLDERPRRRAGVLRLLRRWWPVPAVLVVALVAWQLVGDARERDRLGRLRADTDVIGTTLTPPLTATAWGTDAVAQVIATGSVTTDGMIAGLVRERADGPWEVVGLDLATGDERWRAVVAPATTGAGLSPTVDCVPDDDPARTLWCTVLAPEITSDATDDGAQVTVRASSIGVHLADGSALAPQPLPDAATALVVDGRRVVVSRTAVGLDVVATDAGSGAPAWQISIPHPIETDTGLTPAVGVSGGFLRINGGTSSATVDPADGTVLATGSDTVVRRGDWLVVAEGSSRTTVLRSTEGAAPEITTGEETVPGVPALLRPDDGSAPDLLVLDVMDGTAAGRMRAVDARTGEVRWETAGRDVATNAMLLDDTLYGSTGRTLWARDLLTGDLLWETATDQSRTATALLTDGASVLRVERDVTTGETVLAAYGMHDGRQRWTTPLPEGVTPATTAHGMLFGWSATGAVRLD